MRTASSASRSWYYASLFQKIRMWASVREREACVMQSTEWNLEAYESEGKMTLRKDK